MTNFMFQRTSEEKKDYSSENIHELAMKTLIHFCRYTSEAMLDVDLKELLEHIANLYMSFSTLAK